MRKLTLAAALVAVALTVSGCKPGQFATKIMDGIEDVVDAVQVGVGYARTVADKYCVQVADALAQANSLTVAVGASCKAKNEVQRVASGVASYCNNPGPVDVRSFLDKLKKAKAEARAAVAAGC